VHHLHHLITTYGYWALALLVGLEGVGIPAPGETALISAAIYAGHSKQLNIALVIVTAALGALVGDNLGYWLGRWLGTRLLLRYGHRVGLNDSMLKLGQYLFLRYGSPIIAVGRFVAPLRMLAPFLAGANRMPWRRFFVFNLCGGLLWTTSVSTAAYTLGHVLDRLTAPAGIAVGVLTALAFALAIVQIRRHLGRLQEEAERALPGPLR
jgi:membrane protein DedA with SNARE-associated domain